MTVFLSANNATTTLAGALTTGATLIQLATGTGALFPSPTTGQYFSVTLNDALTGDVYEICYCTSRTGDQLTVTRGQEGTAAVTWLIGDFAYRALTAAQEQNLIQKTSAAGGSLSGQYPNPGIAATAVTAGRYVAGTFTVGSDGRLTGASNAPARGGFSNSTPGTYSFTVPADIDSVLLEIWGGGGGGGGSTGAPSGGRAGGGAGYIWALISVAPAQVISYTVGAGGAGGANANGNDGGNSTFGSYLISGGGQGGQDGASGFGTTGGTGGGTTVGGSGIIAVDALTGSGGGLSGAFGTVAVYGGQGGGSFGAGSGQNAFVGYTSATAGLAGVVHGGGGGGGMNGGNGGNGANGSIRLWYGNL